jgi:hypothetical protein
VIGRPAGIGRNAEIVFGIWSGPGPICSLDYYIDCYMPSSRKRPVN